SSKCYPCLILMLCLDPAREPRYRASPSAHLHSRRGGQQMISRTVSCTIDPAQVDEFRTTLNTQLPRIQAQPGFIDNIESLDPATGKFSCLTLWRSTQDVENYDKGLF